MRYNSFVHIRFFLPDLKKAHRNSNLGKKENQNTRNITGLKKAMILLYTKVKVVRILFECYANPLDMLHGMRYLYNLRKGFLGNSEIVKINKVEKKYYFSLFTPAINDAKFTNFIKWELNRFKKIKNKTNRFNHIFIAITKKCPLQCEHCYEWDRLNGKENLDEIKLKKILTKIQQEGVSEIHLTGGEPLLKFDMIINLLAVKDLKTDFWINSSGYQLTNEKAVQLKASGLKGIFISLDHFEEKEHDRFRHTKNSFFWATEAAINAVNNNLVVILSICVRKEFVTELNLVKYMKLAKKLGVSFVQFLEPKAVGHYADAEISLSNKQIELLESFFKNYNFNKEYITYPLICYHGYYQRRIGCLSAKNSGFYIDPNGGINPCPFCHQSSGNILDDNFEEAMDNLKKIGCPNIKVS